MLKRITGPGAFRLFLAFIVFFNHTTSLAVGEAAVLIFFNLSGYWIYKMYLDRYSATRQPYLTYVVSRMWRLLPTFWLVTLLTVLYLADSGSLASYWNGSNPIHFIVSNLFVFGYQTLQAQMVGPAWSLDIEMQFYLIAPFIAIFLARKRVPPAWSLFAIAAVSLASILLQNPVALINYLVFFAVGMVAASVDWRPSGKLALISIGATTLLVASLLATPWRGVLLIGVNPGPLAIFMPYANLAMALLMAPYAIFTTGRKGFSADGIFGDLSCIIYLFHWVVTIWLGRYSGSVLHKLPYTVVAWIVVIAMSLAIWKFYDHPINRMRSRWVSSRKIVTASQARPTPATRVEAAT